MPTPKLTAEEINNSLAQLPGWSVANNKLNKAFKFGNFVEAFGFLTKVAIIAEKMDHHPEIYNVYNRVTIDLVTHDAGGITLLDIELAQKIESIS